MKLYNRGEPYPIDELIKKAAITPVGRTEWSVYKTMGGNIQLFPLEIKKWSISQKLFVYWSIFYDNIYESMDRPPDRVIKNNELLEIWLKQQEDKSKEFAEKNWSKAPALHEIKTARDHAEVITFGDEE